MRVTRGIGTTRTSVRRWLVLVTVLVVGLLGAAAVAPAPAAATISSRILTILKEEHCAGSLTGISVWAGSTTHAAYARNNSTPLRPASNTKLVTAAAALQQWGPDHRFKTELYLPGIYATTPYDIGVVQGDVYLKGYGDPSLSTTSFAKSRLGVTTTSSIEALVGHLKVLGVTQIVGHVVADASWFDDKKRVAVWNDGIEENCGPLSALSVNEGLRFGRRVKDPALYSARRLTWALEDAGIAVTGSAEKGIVPSDAWLTATLVSARLRTLLKPLLKDSDNFFAEMFVKGLGKDYAGEGSTLAGLTVVRGTLTTLGLDAATLRVTDGSGLSYQNWFTAGAVAKLLRTMAAREDFPLFWAALAIAGRDGTLEDRMRGTAAQGNLHGKTGTLSVASALSGYVTDSAGRRVTFTILVNGRPLNVWYAHQAQDRIAVLLAKSTL